MNKPLLLADQPTNQPSALKTILFCAVAVIIGFAATLTPTQAHATLDGRFLQAKMAIAAPSAAQQLCYKYDWACSTSRGTTAKLTQADVGVVHQINKSINRQIREVSDKSQYRKTDYWTLPSSRRGDCEDIALLKKKHLIKAGIAPERLLMATVLDRKRRGHAVLILRTNSGDYVLDNLTNKIKPWSATGYTFLRMQNPDAPRKWVGLMVRG